MGDAVLSRSASKQRRLQYSLLPIVQTSPICSVLRPQPSQRYLLMWRKAITASTTFCRLRSSSAPPVGKDDMAPAAAVEFRPGALRLGEAVGDGVDHRRMMAEAAVAAIDLDVLGLGPVLVQAGLPGADAVGAAEDGGRRHRRRLGQRIKQVLLFDLAAAHDLIGAPGIGRFG